MKFFIYVLFVTIFIALLAEGQSASNTVSHSNGRGKKVNRDSVGMEYFDLEPQIISKPRIIIPDSLRPVKKQ